MILLTGGSGVLGKELQKVMQFQSIPSKEQLDITKIIDIVPNGLKLIVHCAAFTDLIRAEKEKELCYQTNVIGTRNLANLGIPMLYISTAYVFDGERGNYDEKEYENPQNFYSLTKLLGEYESRRTRSVVIRCIFKRRPFEHALACDDQFSSPLYADEIAPLIAWAVKEFDKLPPTLHIGGERKSTFEFARESKRDVKKCKLEDIKSVSLPKDISLNCSLWRSIYGNPLRKS